MEPSDNGVWSACYNWNQRKNAQRFAQIAQAWSPIVVPEMQALIWWEGGMPFRAVVK